MSTAALLDALGPRADALIGIDFESYYSTEYSLKRMTTESYVRDPRFETIGVAVKLGREPAVWMEDQDFRVWARRVRWSRVAVLAHHAHFEGLILSHHYGIRPGRWLCTMSMGRALHGTVQGVSLAALSELYGVGQKGHEVQDAKGKRRRDFTAAEWLRYGGYSCNDIELADRLRIAMVPRLPPLELWQIDTNIRAFAEPVFRANLTVLDDALKAERLKKRAVLERIARHTGAQLSPNPTADQVLEGARAALSSDPKFAEVLRGLGVEPPTKAGKPKPDGTPREIFAFAKSDPQFQELLESESDEVRAVCEARLAVKSTLIETRTERMIAAAKRGPVPFYLRYCGAHTHRDSGGDKMNPQNFTRGGALRAAVEAPDEHVLVVADSGQIEARKVGWLAGARSLLETFRRNDALGKKGDFYSDEGAKFFSKKLSKEDTPEERQISKCLILGLGFSMGETKCAGELLKGMLGTPPVRFTLEHAARFGVSVRDYEQGPRWKGGPTGREQVEGMIARGARLPYAELLVHCAVTAHLVGIYRRTNPEIVKLWRTMDQVLPVMAEDGGDPNEVRVRVGCLEIMRHAIRKPSGMVLHYPGLRRNTDGRGYSYMGGKGGRERVHVYGGLLTENVVQSLARDVVFEQALWIRSKGYRIATKTHDEIVCVVPEAQGPQCLADMLEAMRRPPAWCSDLPLNASGGFARSYGAVK